MSQAMSARTLKKWLGVFESGMLTKTNCTMVCSHHNKTAGGVSAPRINISDPAVIRILDSYRRFSDAFYSLMPDEGYDLTPEQKQAGIEYLWAKLFKKNGHRRNNSYARSIGDKEFDIISNYTDFRFIALYDMSLVYGGSSWYAPVYRCIAKNGDSFDYLGVGGMGAEPIIRVVG